MQHVSPNNVVICRFEMLGSFDQGLILTTPTYFCIWRRVSKKTSLHYELLSKMYHMVKAITVGKISSEFKYILTKRNLHNRLLIKILNLMTRNNSCVISCIVISHAPCNINENRI